MSIMFLVISLAVVASACASPTETMGIVVARGEPIGSTGGDHGVITWANEAVLVVDRWETAPDGRNLGGRLVALAVDGSEPVELPHASSSTECDFIEEFKPIRLADGRIAFIRDCVIYGEAAEPRSIQAIDLSTGEVDLVADLGDPWTAEGWRTGIKDFSVRSDDGDVVVGVGSVICDGIGRAEGGTVVPIDVQVGVAGREANLADIWRLPCKDVVNARLPTWSPRGDKLAVLVSRDVRGLDGWDRLGAEYDLELIDTATWTSHHLTGGLREPYRLAWSPDGAEIGVITDTGVVGETQTWLISTATGSRRLLVLDDGGSLSDVAWSPDGKNLAGLLYDMELDGDDRTTIAVVFKAPGPAD